MLFFFFFSLQSHYCFLGMGTFDRDLGLFEWKMKIWNLKFVTPKPIDDCEYVLQLLCMDSRIQHQED